VNPAIVNLWPFLFQSMPIQIRYNLISVHTTELEHNFLEIVLLYKSTTFSRTTILEGIKKITASNFI